MQERDNCYTIIHANVIDGVTGPEDIASHIGNNILMNYSTLSVAISNNIIVMVFDISSRYNQSITMITWLYSRTILRRLFLSIEGLFL